jgi:Zn-dependent M16 (insulinase) family peptidase
MKNELDSNLAPSGHSYASGRSSRFFSRSRMIDELWNGLDQLKFAHELVDMDVSEVGSKLKDIRTKLSGAGLLLNLAAGSPANAEKEMAKLFGSFGPPRPRKPNVHDMESFRAFAEHKGKPEVFASPSLQVGFASVSFAAAPYGSPLQAAELVLSHLLSTGALWEDIRMKGGAYGAFAHPDSLEGVFLFSTYRDPGPLRSLEAFSSIIRDKASVKVSGNENKDSLDKAVIGAYSRETRPRTPAEKNLADFLRFLYGIEDNHRAQRLKDLVAANEDQINAVLKRLSLEESKTPVIIAGPADAEKAAARLGVEVQDLPV